MKELEQIKEQLDRIELLLISNKRVLTMEEAHKYTGISQSYLYKLTSAGEIPCSKPGGKLVFFCKDELDEWLLSRPKLTRKEIDMRTSTYVALRKTA